MARPLDFIALLDGLYVNSSQAATAAGVKRPVVPTWAKRHADFPLGSRPEGSSSTLYSAADFVTWCSHRNLSKPLEQVAVDLAVFGVANAHSRASGVQAVYRFLIFCTVYRQLDYVEGERPTALLRRCATHSLPLAKLAEPYLLSIGLNEFCLFSRLGALVACLSISPLASFELFLSALQRGTYQSLSEPVGNFLDDLLDELGTGVHLHFSRFSREAVSVQLLRFIATGGLDKLHGVSSSEVGQVEDLVCLFQVFRAADSLYDPCPDMQLEDAGTASSIFTYLALDRAHASYEKYWEEISQIVDDAPENVPIVVLGRSEFLTDPVREGSPARSAHTDMLRYGHMVAVVELGTKTLRSESSVPLAVAVFENHRVSDDTRPRIAAFDLAGCLDSASDRRKAVLHDLGALVYEDWSSAVHSSSGEHALVAGQSVPWQVVTVQGIHAGQQTVPGAKPGQERVNAVNVTTRYLQTSLGQELPDLQWRVAQKKRSPGPTVEQLIDRRTLRRVAGHPRSKIPAELLQPVNPKDAHAWVRVVDKGFMAGASIPGQLPGVFRGLHATDLAQLGDSVELALPGDIAVSEESAETYLVGADEGLVIVQSPVFILRRVGTEGNRSSGLGVLARLIRAGLQEQRKAGARRVTVGSVHVPQVLVDAVFAPQEDLSPGAQSLEVELSRLSERRRALQEQLAALDELEQETLAGLSEGTIEFLQ